MLCLLHLGAELLQHQSPGAREECLELAHVRVPVSVYWVVSALTITVLLFMSQSEDRGHSTLC